MTGESESLADALLFLDPGTLVALEPVKVMGGDFSLEASARNTVLLTP